MSTEIVEKKASPLETMKALFTKYTPDLKALLPVGVTEKEVVSSAINACRENPALLECTPQSMLGAVAKCCQLGLPPADGTHRACIVPFNNSKKGCKEAQLIIEYRGLVYLIQNLSDITPNNQVVCKNDTFNYELGTKPFVSHKIALEDRGEVIGAYAILSQDGFPPMVEYMNKKEIDSIRARSRASSSGPWVTDYPMMARKTVLRRVCRLAPMGTKRGELLQQAVLLDEKAELGIAQDLGLFVDPTAVGTVAVSNEDRQTEAKNPAPTLGKPIEASEAVMMDFKIAIGEAGSDDDIKRLLFEAKAKVSEDNFKMLEAHGNLTARKLKGSK